MTSSSYSFHDDSFPRKKILRVIMVGVMLLVGAPVVDSAAETSMTAPSPSHLRQRSIPRVLDEESEMPQTDIWVARPNETDTRNEYETKRGVDRSPGTSSSGNNVLPIMLFVWLLLGCGVRYNAQRHFQRQQQEREEESQQVQRAETAHLDFLLKHMEQALSKTTQTVQTQDLLQGRRKSGANDDLMDAALPHKGPPPAIPFVQEEVDVEQPRSPQEGDEESSLEDKDSVEPTIAEDEKMEEKDPQEETVAVVEEEHDAPISHEATSPEEDKKSSSETDCTDASVSAKEDNGKVSVTDEESNYVSKLDHENSDESSSRTEDKLSSEDVCIDANTSMEDGNHEDLVTKEESNDTHAELSKETEILERNTTVAVQLEDGEEGSKDATEAAAQHDEESATMTPPMAQLEQPLEESNKEDSVTHEESNDTHTKLPKEAGTLGQNMPLEDGDEGPKDATDAASQHDEESATMTPPMVQLEQSPEESESSAAIPLAAPQELDDSLASTSMSQAEQQLRERSTSASNQSFLNRLWSTGSAAWNQLSSERSSMNNAGMPTLLRIGHPSGGKNKEEGSPSKEASPDKNNQKDEHPTAACVVERTVPNLCAICLEPYYAGEEVTWSPEFKHEHVEGEDQELCGCQHAFHTVCFREYASTVLAKAKTRQLDDTPSEDGNNSNGPIVPREGVKCPMCRQAFVVLPPYPPVAAAARAAHERQQRAAAAAEAAAANTTAVDTAAAAPRERVIRGGSFFSPQYQQRQQG